MQYADVCPEIKRLTSGRKVPPMQLHHQKSSILRIIMLFSFRKNVIFSMFLEVLKPLSEVILNHCFELPIFNFLKYRTNPFGKFSFWKTQSSIPLKTLSYGGSNIICIYNQSTQLQVLSSLHVLVLIGSFSGDVHISKP